MDRQARLWRFAPWPSPIDFDFVSDRPLDPTALAPAIPYQDGATVVQREPNILSCIVDRDGPVKLSFFGLARIPRLRPPVIAPDNGLEIASLLDLAGISRAVKKSIPLTPDTEAMARRVIRFEPPSDWNLTLDRYPAPPPVRKLG